MTAPQPKTKAEELFERVQNLTLEERRDRLLLQRLKQQAKQSLSVDLFHGHLALGIISLIENNIIESRRFFENLARLRPTSYLPYFNYSITLARAGYFDEAKEQAKIALELNPGSPEVLLTDISAHLFAGNISSALNKLMEFNKFKLAGHLKEEAESLSGICSFLNKNKVLETELDMLQRTTFSILHENGIFFTLLHCHLSEDEDSKFVSFEIMVDRPVTEIVDLNFKLAERLAAIEPVMKAAYFVIFHFSTMRD